MVAFFDRKGASVYRRICPFAGDIGAVIEVLPHSSGVNGSRHGHMRELRTQFGGRPLRTLYAFDPRRKAILLIGGDKTGNDRWYEEYVPVADDLYDEHLDVLRKEGLLDGKEIF
jgi:hypothetical protein